MPDDQATTPRRHGLSPEPHKLLDDLMSMSVADLDRERLVNLYRLTNTKHVSLLPPAWGTLYELTKLDDDDLSRARRTDPQRRRR